MGTEDEFDRLRIKLKIRSGGNSLFCIIISIIESVAVDIERIANALEDMRDAGPNKTND